MIADLDVQYPGIGDRLIDDSGLRRFVNVYLNDEDVRFLDGIDTALSDGDVVTVLPAVAGEGKIAGAQSIILRDKTTVDGAGITIEHGVFRQVVRMRLEWVLREGKGLTNETVALWNSVR